MSDREGLFFFIFVRFYNPTNGYLLGSTGLMYRTIFPSDNAAAQAVFIFSLSSITTRTPLLDQCPLQAIYAERRM